jgi:hypothetical protein
VTRRGELLLDSNSSVVTIVFIAICLSAAPPDPPAGDRKHIAAHVRRVEQEEIPFYYQPSSVLRHHTVVE